MRSERDRSPSIPAGTAEVSGRAEVKRPPGAGGLDGYPLLVYAPNQWGEGVRTEDRGLEVEKVVEAYRYAGEDAAVAAQELNTTEAHVADAVRYVAEHADE